MNKINKQLVEYKKKMLLCRQDAFKQRKVKCNVLNWNKEVEFNQVLYTPCITSNVNELQSVGKHYIGTQYFLSSDYNNKLNVIKYFQKILNIITKIIMK